MTALRFDEILQPLDAELRGAATVRFRGVSIDTRTLLPWKTSKNHFKDGQATRILSFIQPHKASASLKCCNPTRLV